MAQSSLRKLAVMKFQTNKCREEIRGLALTITVLNVFLQLFAYVTIIWCLYILYGYNMRRADGAFWLPAVIEKRGDKWHRFLMADLSICGCYVKVKLKIGTAMLALRSKAQLIMCTTRTLWTLIQNHMCLPVCVAFDEFYYQCTLQSNFAETQDDCLCAMKLVLQS
ncbi:hypothetical protein SUGI_0806270 [Cryptomeria japonica]|nr:hypothetical protein SUGI_0806270 [Cryptomeria japonica]